MAEAKRNAPGLCGRKIYWSLCVSLCGRASKELQGQHAHCWMDEQGRVNLEWGNRLGLHVLIMDRSVPFSLPPSLPLSSL